MKIVSRFFMLLLCLVLASACAQDEPLAPENGGNTSTPELSTRTIRMTAGTASAGDVTRTTLEGVNVLWDEGDQFRVMDTNGLDWVMKADEDAKGHTSGGFKGSTTSDVKPTNTAMAVFPSDGLTSYTDGNLTITIPQTQTYVAGSFDHKANVMAGPVTPVTGETDTYSAEFYNMMGVLKLQLTGEHDFLTSIKITDKAGKKISGTATLSAKDFSKGISVDNIQDGSSSITLNCGFVELTETPTDFYFVVPVGAFSQGFDVEFTNSNDTPSTIKKTSSNNHSIKINSIKKMANMKVDGFKVEEVNIENEAVKAYMSQIGSPKFGSATLITNSITNNNSLKNQDRPLEHSLTWSADTKNEYGVSLTNLASDHVGKFATKHVTSNTYSFTNLVPGCHYIFEVKNTTGTIVKAGKFHVTDSQIRMIRIEDSWNYRDLGGWSSSIERAKVQYEWIYRGASLNGKWKKNNPGEVLHNNQATTSDYTFSTTSRDQIEDMGIKAELDLRQVLDEEDWWTRNTKRETPHCFSIGNNTKFNDDYWTFYRISSGGGMENPKNDPTIVKDVAWIIDQVVNQKHPVAFHCKSGADRTGCVAMLILGLLGVDEGDVAKDYELTTFSREYSILESTTSSKYKTGFRTKKANDINSNYKFFTNGFTTLGKGSMQKNAYYYLNQHFASTGYAISSTDLDRFIAKMLGLSSYTQDGGVPTDKTLQDIYSK